MASQPLETPEAVALQHARRDSRRAWGHHDKIAQAHQPKPGGGGGDFVNIGSHERVEPAPARLAMREAGRSGLPAPNGPKGPNAPAGRGR